MQVTCRIVDENHKPIYHAMVVVDGQLHQLNGSSLTVTTGQHDFRVKHRRFITEEGRLNVTGDFEIVLGGDPASLLA
jgi:hypothetical protein